MSEGDWLEQWSGVLASGSAGAIEEAWIGRLEQGAGEGGELVEALRRLRAAGKKTLAASLLELAADEAVYERSDGRLTLNGGRPILRKVEGEWTTALKADGITATEAPRRVSARGHVKGWMIFKDRAKLKELARCSSRRRTSARPTASAWWSRDSPCEWIPGRSWAFSVPTAPARPPRSTASRAS